MTKPEINNINSWDVELENTTPVMRQYLEIKRENPDVILLYRLGDFYETFFEDAHVMARELELTLTGRDAGAIGRIPLAGIPAKAADNYSTPHPRPKALHSYLLSMPCSSRYDRRRS